MLCRTTCLSFTYVCNVFLITLCNYIAKSHIRRLDNIFSCAVFLLGDVIWLIVTCLPIVSCKIFFSVVKRNIQRDLYLFWSRLVLFRCPKCSWLSFQNGINWIQQILTIDIIPISLIYRAMQASSDRKITKEVIEPSN